MKLFAVIMTATLLSGCASKTTHLAAESSAVFSSRSWQQVQTALQGAPIELRDAITQEGELRLRHTEQALSPDVTEPQAALLGLLLHTRNPLLTPDAKFENFHAVIAGQNQNLPQAFAAALTHYLTQPDFGCKQPVYADYFRQRYSANGIAKSCPAEIPFLVLTRYDGAKPVWLNPKRVSSIHLMFAGKSQSLASRFGHVALRLVICPEDSSTAAECDANLFEHIVLGYQAYIDELSLDTLKALNGEYKAYLFANRFVETYEEYAIGEFREIYSLPLRLNEAQQEKMLRDLSDIHWRYAGSYSFFTRNCSTMLQNALRASWPEFANHNQMNSDYLRPDSFFDALKSTQLADANKIDSLDVAEREGYYFSSTQQFYDRALDTVRMAMNKPAFADLGSYLQINPIQRRQARAEDKQFSAHLASDQHLREAQLMLEEYAIVRSERLMMIKGAKYLEQQNFLANKDSIRSQLDAEHAKVFEDCLLTPIMHHARPLHRLDGIPEKSDIPATPDQMTTCQSIQSRILLSEAIAVVKDAKSELWQQLNEISRYWAESIANVGLLKEM